MKNILLSLLIVTGLHNNGNTQAVYKLSASVKKILFLGNSITWNGEYINYINTYFSLQHPDQQIEIINAGLPSETVSGLSEPGHAAGKFPRPDLHERLDRVLKAIKPDFVIACYGMNDGIYMPFDDSRFIKFKEGITWLHNEILKAGISIIHITPPIFDERKGEAYANVLDVYTNWLISLRYTAGWNVIDVHWPMKKYLEDRRFIDTAFVLAPDGIHPQATGHWLMAKQILLYLGASEVAKADSLEEVFSSYKNFNKILNLIRERQEILRDAWLTFTGHKRPGLPQGLTINEANNKVNSIDKKIKELNKD